MGPGSSEVTDVMGGLPRLLLEVEKILGPFWILQIRAAIQLKAEWAAAFLKDFMRRGRNWVTPSLSPHHKTDFSGEAANLKQAFYTPARGKQNEAFPFLMRWPAVWLQLASCSVHSFSSWRAVNFHQIGKPQILLLAADKSYISSGIPLVFYWIFTDRVRWVQSVCFCWCKLFYARWHLE